MSHFTRIKTRMAEKEYLLAALTDLGYSPEVGGEVRGYGGRKVQAEVKVATQSAGYDIGFYRQGDFYEVVADWYGLRGLGQAKFVEQLTQRYAYQATRAKLEAQGFSLITEENQQDGRIHLVVRRMA